MRTSSLSGLDLLEGPPWSMMPSEVTLVPVVHAAAPGLDEGRDPRRHMRSVSLTEALAKTLGFCCLWGLCVLM